MRMKEADYGDGMGECGEGMSEAVLGPMHDRDRFVAGWMA